MRPALLLALALCLAPLRAESKEALRVELVPKAQAGQGQPALVVHAEAALSRLELDVVRSSDRRRLKLQAGPLAAGRAHRFPLELSGPGSATFEGRLAVVLPSGEKAEMPIQVTGELVPPIALEVAPGDVDLAARRLWLRANRALARVEVSLVSELGAPLGVTNVELSEPAADGRYAVAWEQGKGAVLSIALKGYDADGFFGGLELFPWRVDIPHEEVQFRTGSSEIDPTEAPKLQASQRRVEDAVRKFGKLAAIRLFIAGHTDTVGSAAANRALSRDRARAIGRWFRAHGVRIPILYAGFGEDRLAVGTADETDEARNRRAEYIVAVEPPMSEPPFVSLDDS